MEAKFFYGRVCDVSEKGAYWPNTVTISLYWSIPCGHHPFFSDLPLRYREMDTKRFAALHNIASPGVEVTRGDDIAFVALADKDGDRFEFGGIYLVNGNTTEWGDHFDEKLREICTVTHNLADD